jgi:hypothetical protein
VGEKVKAGEAFRPPAAAQQNAWTAAADAHAAEMLGKGGSIRREPLTTDLVKIKNSSGSDLAAGSVLQLDGHLLTTQAIGFPWFDGDDPTSVKNCGVLVKAIESGVIGYMQMSGIVLARVSVGDTGHSRASFTASSNVLTSNMHGQAEILSPISSTGTQDLWVRICDRGSVQVKVKTPAGGIAAGSWNVGCTEFTPGSATCTVLDWDGTKYSGSETDTVNNPSRTAIAGSCIVTAATDEWDVLTALVEDCEGACS